MKTEDPNEIAVSLLVEAIHRRYGYDLRNYAKAFLDRRLTTALARFDIANLGELQHRVLNDPEVFRDLLEMMVIPTTEMFRDPEFFLAFRWLASTLLRTYPVLRIWHGGCASGEEVYAAAIVLQEEGLYDRCQIYATDLSARALSLASAGVYPADRAESFGSNYALAGGTAKLSHYYTEGYGGISMRESLRRNVLFFQHDLVSDYVFGEMHVIFCRNVLIYFDRDLKLRVLTKFRESLREGGLLCLGSAERLSAEELSLGFRELAPDARIYRCVHGDAETP